LRGAARWTMLGAMESRTTYDVVIVGGGPAGLAAALNLGRARKRVALFDAGRPRNALAHAVHGFVTRDGIAPADFRRAAREQLARYDVVELREAAVGSVTREGELFTVVAGEERFEARRVLLCVGMVDEIPDLPGYRELWARSIFQCPFCHGWEVRDGAFGVLATQPIMAEFAFMLTAWSRDLVVFTGGALAVADELRARLEGARIRLEERPIRGLVARDGRLEAVELADGEQIPRQVLFARPPQRQTPLVASLGLALDEQGFVRVDEHKGTSVDGIHAAGDLTTMRQGALVAAAEGAMAAYMLTHALTLEALAREPRAPATRPA
jgi:thioredoxin reductase